MKSCIYHIHVKQRNILYWQTRFFKLTPPPSSLLWSRRFFKVNPFPHSCPSSFCLSVRLSVCKLIRFIYRTIKPISTIFDSKAFVGGGDSSLVYLSILKGEVIVKWYVLAKIVKKHWVIFLSDFMYPPPRKTTIP